MIPRIPGHLLVVVQFAGIGLSIYPFDHSGHNSSLFLLFSAVGVVTGLSALLYNRIGNFRVYPEIRPGFRLITDGPYRYIRHPMYTSVILAVLGISCYLNSPLNYVGLCLTLIAVTLKAIKEEHLISQENPAYKEYMSRTTRFIPYIL